MNMENLVQTMKCSEVELIKRASKAKDATKKHARKMSMALVDAACWSVCHFTSLPQWMQDNDYLHTGHRPQLGCMKACAKSVFRIHSETGNIWTHLIGCLATISLSIYLYFLSPYANQLRTDDKIMFGFYLFTATCCLAFSTVFHTFCCHSHETSKLCSKLDYCGISLLATGSFVPWIYYAFYCNASLKLIYLSLVPISGLAVIAFSLMEHFGSPEYRSVRATIFVAFGLSICIPFMHWFWSVTHVYIDLTKVFLVAFFYVGGAFLYAIRVPERFFPGKCDYMFQSHQIFHVCVVAAVIIHYLNIHDIASIFIHATNDQVCSA
ncbi:Adiponectin receptor protein [Halotydeus destructor]|nr:Adiponectin receptor protein [Halotydeus destructor]